MIQRNYTHLNPNLIKQIKKVKPTVIIKDSFKKEFQDFKTTFQNKNSHAKSFTQTKSKHLKFTIWNQDASNCAYTVLS
jgi:hypothetical protein